ncbi:MAG TPA: enoyl-CoA hydratase/isomerase family protein [Acidiphilium sp.]
MSDTETDVLIRVRGKWGHITLNRPRALNALTDAMCDTISDALGMWAQDDAIVGVLIDGAGERAFCAGGDIRALYEASRAGDYARPAAFFAREYRLNTRIARFPKPYVALMDGITMGGGVGLSAHGAYRVVTERTMLAMPEVGIGFFPDVGATFLLGRVPGELGVHVALTAGRLSGEDAIAIDLADFYTPSARLGDLRDALLESSDPKAVPAILGNATETPPSSALAAMRSLITKSYSYGSIEEILAALDASGIDAAREAAAAIRQQSPFAVKLSLRALRAARRIGVLEPCLDQEYRLALRGIRTHDFIEGVRAAVVDKDRNPRWSPATLEAVDDAAVDACFESLGDAELGLAAAELTTIES